MVGGMMSKMRLHDSPSARRRNAVPDWLVWALGGALVLAALLSGYLVFSLVRNLVSAWTGTGPTPFSFTGFLSATTASGEAPLPVILESTPIPWNGSDRVTILVMGLDYRDWEEGSGAPRSDSMMLITVDPVA